MSEFELHFVIITGEVGQHNELFCILLVECPWPSSPKSSNFQNWATLYPIKLPIYFPDIDWARLFRPQAFKISSFNWCGKFDKGKISVIFLISLVYWWRGSLNDFWSKLTNHDFLSFLKHELNKKTYLEFKFISKQFPLLFTLLGIQKLILRKGLTNKIDKAMLINFVLQRYGLFEFYTSSPSPSIPPNWNLEKIFSNTNRLSIGIHNFFDA